MADYDLVPTPVGYPNPAGNASDRTIPLGGRSSSGKVLIEPEPVSSHSSTSSLATFAKATLFPDTNPKADDVIQGDVSNCPLGAILAALAHAKSSDVKKMIAKKDGKIRSRRKKEKQKDEVSMSHGFAVMFPKRKSGTFTHRLYVDKFKKLTYGHSPKNKASWVRLVEKGYVVAFEKELRHEARVEDGRNVKGYEVLDWPDPQDVFERAIGDPDVFYNPKEKNGFEWDKSPADLEKILSDASKAPTIACTYSDPSHADLIGKHCYAVLKYDKQSKNVELYNALIRPLENLKAFEPRHKISKTEFEKDFLVIYRKK